MKLILFGNAAFAQRSAPKRSAKSVASGGFTLIELMIVVAIVAILAAIAYPSYRDSVLKGKRAEGRAAVLDLLQQEERFLTQTNSYMAFTAGGSGANGTIADASGSAVGSQTIPFKTFSGDNAANAAYMVGARACPSPNTYRECVEVYANTVSANSDPAADTLWARSTGEKSCTGNKPAICWK